METENSLGLRDSVRKAYSAAAEKPHDKHPFPVGRSFAESLGYPLELLSDLPSVSVNAFSGVSNVAIFADIPVGSKVLDLGCGAGLDTLIAARKAGLQSRVIGVDFSAAMLNRALQAVREVGLENVKLSQADGENLPVKDGSIDVVLVNGIFNLNPARDAVFHELARVVRSGGAVYVAELILKEAVMQNNQVCEGNWFS
jgi:SAM-dependent methyltransferase